MLMFCFLFLKQKNKLDVLHPALRKRCSGRYNAAGSSKKKFSQIFTHERVCPVNESSVTMQLTGPVCKHRTQHLIRVVKADYLSLLSSNVQMIDIQFTP